MLNRPGVAGDAAHPARRRIVDDAAQQRQRPAPSHGHAERGVHRSVGAMRGRTLGGGRNVVSLMPSGSKICAVA